MRPPVDEPRIRALAHALSLVARGPVRIYLTGGATAVLEGWRAATIDVDVRFEPEADELLRALPDLKNSLGINIELASPPDFIPELPGWRERSPLVFEEGKVAVHHFDPYSQALSKIERGFEQDIADVQSLITHGLVDPVRLREHYDAIEPELYRYPAIEPPAFRRKVGSRAHSSFALARPASRAQAGEGTRTPDPLFTRQALYQLSYSGVTPESSHGKSVRACNGAG